MNKNIDIIGVQLDQGASTRGVNMGPLAIRHAGFHEGLDALNLNWDDKGDVIPMQDGESRPNLKNYEAIVDANEQLYKKVKATLAADRMPIVLGGDHSIAAGSIPAVNEVVEDLGIIWIDAHGDFNNDQITESGNMHGMPYSAVTGNGPESMIPFSNARVNPKKCVQIAGRDIDMKERENLKKAGVTVFSIHEVDKIGIPKVIEESIKIAGPNIHVSFDLDAVTPDEAPGVGTPVHSGLSVREAFLIMEELHISDKVVSCDMVEVNPVFDIRNKTGRLASELILALLGKTVF